MADKKYCNGSGKVFKFDDGGSILNLSIQPEQLVEYLAELNKERAAEGEEPTKYLNLSVARKREPGKYGDTHYAYVRPFKPSKKKEATQGKEDTDELPF
jgi:hypothetical protein